MELIVANEILRAFGFVTEEIKIQQIGSGHINRTYLLSMANQVSKYILQNINLSVFKEPHVIANNIKVVADALKESNPAYFFPSPIPTIDGELMFHHKGEYWRLLPFVPNTVALTTLSDPKQAYEAAKQFGKLSRLLKDLDPSNLEPTIPGFHDLAWRYEQFTFAVSDAAALFTSAARNEIELALHHRYLVDYYRSFEHSDGFPDRVMHHDTKITNVLLDENDFHGICVIDLDTLMPGKFISDLGDMMRTYLCAFSEDEPDLSKINIRLPYFKATVAGYLSEMANVLTKTEKELILFSGKYIIYMQALRFLTDYLNGSSYYPIIYPTQNLDRARNQFRLLNEMIIHEKILQGIVDEALNAQ